MTAMIGIPHPLAVAQVAQLTIHHLSLLAGVDDLASALEAGMSPSDAAIELRAMAATVRETT